MKQNSKVTDIFEVIRRLPDVNLKYSFISPFVFLCGLAPLIVSGNVDENILIVLAVVTVVCPVLMLVAFVEKDAEYKHIKMLTFFESELIITVTICFNILLYYVYRNILINALITILLVVLRVFKIHLLEKKIKDGTYGYVMNGKMNAVFIGLTSLISARIGMGINNSDNPAFRGAAYLGALLLILDVLLILFAVDPIVALRIKLRKKNNEVKKCQN